MKTSTFLTKVLNKFGNGKNYTRQPFMWAANNVDSRDYVRTRSSKGKDNLVGMIERVAKANDLPRSFIQKTKISLATSLGHTNVDGFATSSNTTFGTVKSVVRAAIRHERASGN